MERFLIRSQDLLQGIPFEVLDNQIGEGYDAVVLSADAQATIAALQAERDTARRRVDELEAREVDVVLLRDDLEQRTAELEAAKQKAAEQGRYAVEMFDELKRVQAELERVRAERDHAKKMEAVQKEVADNQTWHAQKLRTLIAANKETKHDAI